MGWSNYHSSANELSGKNVIRKSKVQYAHQKKIKTTINRMRLSKHYPRFLLINSSLKNSNYCTTRLETNLR